MLGIDWGDNVKNTVVLRKIAVKETQFYCNIANGLCGTHA